MRLQVRGSKIGYFHSHISSSQGLALEFDVFPTDLGELNFSDGRRLLGIDLSEKWDEPLTLGEISNELRCLGYNGIGEGAFWPLRTIVFVTSESPKNINFLKDEEFACGFAEYHKEEYGEYAELRFRLFVSEDTFRELLRLRIDLPAGMKFDVGVRGLENRSYSASPTGLHGTWDLDDKSDCGDGRRRIVTGFSLSREISFFNDRERKWRNQDKEERGQAENNLHAMVGEMVAIANGRIEGRIEKLLRLCLILLSAIFGVGVLLLILIFFH